MTNLRSTIEWTDTTWNATTGCTKVSPGCDNCYAEKITERFHGKGAFARVTLHADRLDAPFRWRKPRRVFVNSMSDLFHSAVPDEFVARVWCVMALTPRHTYQVLTKRHGRMRSLLASGERWTSLLADAFDTVTDTVHTPPMAEARGLLGAVSMRAKAWVDQPREPLHNVWLGVSVEDQQRADLRVRTLLATPAAVRFVSCEPLLGPVNLGWCSGVDALAPDWCGTPGGSGTGTPHPLLDWVIWGGESGPAARRMDLGWARSLTEQCRDAGVACFGKQLGSAHGLHKGGDISTWPPELQVRQWPPALDQCPMLVLGDGLGDETGAVAFGSAGGAT